MTSGPVLEWVHDERLRIDGTDYVLMNEPKVGDELRIFKPRVMLQEYDPLIPRLQGANIVELGLLDGGSAAYLVQRCEPRRFVGIDQEVERCTRLDRFVVDGGREDQVRLHHGVDQADRRRLQAIVEEEFGDEALDLVIDDASHRYEPTVASFEVLFPRVAAGGLYIIEDWTSDDWLEITFGTLIAHREPMALAVGNQWIARLLDDADDLVCGFFLRWIATVLSDPSSSDHEAALEWRELLRAPGAGPDAVAIDRRLRERVDGADGPSTIHGPTLGTLGLQLLLAVKSLCSAIASVSVTPWWIAVQRGGELPDPFTVEAISGDRLDVLGSYRRLADAMPMT